VQGVQTGIDFLRQKNQRAGVYAGYLDWRSNASGYASGLQDQSVGSLQGHNNYAGVYWTYTADSGWYSDFVLQYSWQYGSARVDSGGSNDIRGNGTLASLEIGKSFSIGQWKVEPQAQIIVGRQKLDAESIANANIEQGNRDSLTSRLGVRLVGDYQTGHGRLQPYGRVNLWYGFNGTDTMTVSGASGSTQIRTEQGYTSAELATGATWALTNTVSVYGELGHMIALGGNQDVSGSYGASVGLKILW
jgi:outer membrane autotransporter protein